MSDFKKLEILFYETESGNSEVADFLESLYSKPESKEKRIVRGRYKVCKNKLLERGLVQSMPHIEHLDGPIWQIRPLPYRILMYRNERNQVVYTSYFRKSSGKTPPHEIKKAKERMKDWEKRNQEG